MLLKQVRPWCSVFPLERQQKKAEWEWLVWFLLRSPRAGQCHDTCESCCSIIVSALLSFPGFSPGRDSVAGWGLPLWTINLGSSWFSVLMCQQLVIHRFIYGGLSSFVGCGSPCNPGPGWCSGATSLVLALCQWQEAPWTLLFMPLPMPQVLGSAPASSPPLIDSPTVNLCLKFNLCSPKVHFQPSLPSPPTPVDLSWWVADTVSASWSAGSSFHLIVLVPQGVSYEKMDISSLHGRRIKMVTHKSNVEQIRSFDLKKRKFKEESV